MLPGSWLSRACAAAAYAGHGVVAAKASKHIPNSVSILLSLNLNFL
jgi:hypothetical protein